MALKAPTMRLFLPGNLMTSARTCGCFPGEFTSECSYFGKRLSVFVRKYLCLRVQR